MSVDFMKSARGLWNYTWISQTHTGRNKNALQLDAYRPLQWPPLDVSTGEYLAGDSLPLEGTWDQTENDIIHLPYEQTDASENTTFPVVNTFHKGGS